jgi:tetratricopeptide (TPR) repeat protein
MRKVTVTLFAILALVLATSSFAQVRGRGRLQGNVVDKATGKPIAGATITISGQSTQPIISKTSSNGHWAAIGMTSGSWNIDISAPGYETLRGSVGVSESQQNPLIESKLAPSVKEEAPAAAVQTTPLIPPDAVAAIKEGQELLQTKGATEAETRENAKKAVADFEKAVPQVPDKPETKDIKKQIMEVMAQAYYKAGDLPKAIATLEQLNVSDPWTTADANLTQRNLLLVNLYLEHGDLDKGKALIEKLPAEAVTDPTIFTNIGILFMNKKNPADAITYFGKAIALDPKSGPGYYYRGLAEAQLHKTADARADFEQVIALAPTSSEANDAKQMLAALPKK